MPEIEITAFQLQGHSLLPGLPFCLASRPRALAAPCWLSPLACHLIFGFPCDWGKQVVGSCFLSGGKFFSESPVDYPLSFTCSLLDKLQIIPSGQTVYFLNKNHGSVKKNELEQSTEWAALVPAILFY